MQMNKIQVFLLRGYSPNSPESPFRSGPRPSPSISLSMPSFRVPGRQKSFHCHPSARISPFLCTFYPFPGLLLLSPGFTLDVHSSGAPSLSIPLHWVIYSHACFQAYCPLPTQHCQTLPHCFVSLLTFSHWTVTARKEDQVQFMLRSLRAWKDPILSHSAKHHGLPVPSWRSTLGVGPWTYSCSFFK